MQQMLAENKTEFFQLLEQQFNSKMDDQQTQAVQHFAQRYYRNSSLDELKNHQIDHIYGATLSCWQFLQRFNPKQAKIRVFNPDYEQHGWQSTHTVIEVLIHDIPFVVDSVRMSLNRQGLTIHQIQNAVLHSRRDPNHQLIELLDTSQPIDGVLAEAMLYVEVDRHSSKADLQQIEQQLEQVLSQVQLVVTDFSAMAAKVDKVVSQLDLLDSFKPAEVKECKQFLKWLQANHFTFLGYEEFDFSDDAGGLTITPLVNSRLGIRRLQKRASGAVAISSLGPTAQAAHLNKKLLSFAKSSTQSRVHRPAYPDTIVIKGVDKQGAVISEKRLYGLFTASVYADSPKTIPILRTRVASVLKRAGFDLMGHNGKELQQILEVYPRDELFQMSTDSLFDAAMGVLQIQERHQIKLFVRKDTFGKYLSCLLYVPRDIYNTELRKKVQALLIDRFQAYDAEFTTYFSESVLARTHFIFHVKPQTDIDFDSVLLEKLVQNSARSWRDDFKDTLIEALGEETANARFQKLGSAFPASYTSDFSPYSAVADVAKFDELDGGAALAMSFYSQMEESADILRFKLFHIHQPLPLCDVIPILENLGLRVIGERPYLICDSTDKHYWVHDFTMQQTFSEELDLGEIRDIFQQAFLAVWQTRCDNDTFNHLVLGAGLHWRDIAMLRAYARYMKQILFGFSQRYIAQTLMQHRGITRRLVKFFHCQFDPDLQRDSDHTEQIRCLLDEIHDAMEAVENLNEDRIIRRYLEIIDATLRTNFYQTQTDGSPKSYFSFKFNAESILDLPLPKPKFEIYVYSPLVEGVHLRGGAVARGGLRWSDRREDYRTEVLGLVKAQQVKNAVIVPVGAKGGFIAKALNPKMTREQTQAMGVQCYQLFIRGLLDLTDNRVQGQVVSPPRVCYRDQEDTYLVVAADKGTATFSDIANTIAGEYKFWLKDAFASGGSVGYDHKAMGITAKGAWISVQRHFRSMAVDVQKQAVSVVAIGDMSGDVFGNGMLCSQFICLAAAFNHLHIFVDPNPVAERSYEERLRLFQLSRSSWLDYDASLISAGGGIFQRSAKAIEISPQMQKTFAITEKKLTPNEFIQRLLRAPVDLLWNGGIGTYVKAKTENNIDVGDKSNDLVRVDAHTLRCKVIGEGGNLGFTQLARVDFSRLGGRCYTDFIDNAAGVSCSDREVNIKILLDDIVDKGDLTLKQRNALLQEMTAAVSKMVLDDNYHQAQALSIALPEAPKRFDEYLQVIDLLVSDGLLNTKLEFLPDDEEVQERRKAHLGLFYPELSVLITYVKNQLKQQLNDDSITRDEYIETQLGLSFPAVLSQRYFQELQQHRLRNEIIATTLSNNLVNRMGITFVSRLKQSTGAPAIDISRAYIAARDVFSMDGLWQQLEQLDYQLVDTKQVQLQSDLIRLVRLASRWFVRNRRHGLNIVDAVARFQPGIAELTVNLDAVLSGTARESWLQRCQAYEADSISKELSATLAAMPILYSGLGIIEAAALCQQPLTTVATTYFALVDKLELHWFAEQIAGLPVENRWHAQARETYRDDLEWQQRALTVGVIQEYGDTDSAIDQWLLTHKEMVQRWRQTLDQLRLNPHRDYAMISVAIRELLDLAQSSSKRTN